MRKHSELDAPGRTRPSFTFVHPSRVQLRPIPLLTSRPHRRRRQLLSSDRGRREQWLSIDGPSSFPLKQQAAEQQATVQATSAELCPLSLSHCLRGSSISCKACSTRDFAVGTCEQSQRSGCTSPTFFAAVAGAGLASTHSKAESTCTAKPVHHGGVPLPLQGAGNEPR